MSDRSIKILTITLISFVGGTTIYYLVFTALEGYWIWGNGEIDFNVTGQIGDFIGGFLGTIINGAAFYFLYLTLNEQRKSSLKQSFETKLYDLIHLHRENISELKYSKYINGKMETSEARKVFRVIIAEFIQCYHETKHFVKIYPDLQILKEEYSNSLKGILKRNRCKEPIENIALIDISFCFFYFGLSKESDSILMHKFYNRYETDFIRRLKLFMQLKPKQHKKSLYKTWKSFRDKSMDEKKEIIEWLFQNSKSMEQGSSFPYSVCNNIFANKYYGGHQHRFGHYLRHLFQTFKFLSSQNYLTRDEKYFFGKTIRAQLSTYEQFLLFFNSLTSLGMKWEYNSEIKDKDSQEDYKFITRYNLVKNLPGSQYYDFTYRKFYPKVNFEYFDDITYAHRISKKPKIEKS